MEVTHADEQAMQRIADWKSRGAVLPGPEVHVPFMPYGRTSAEDARRSWQAGVDFREAAVLIGVEPDGRVVLIERAPGGGVHGGQMALPGGSRSRARVSKTVPSGSGVRNWGWSRSISPHRTSSP